MSHRVRHIQISLDPDAENPVDEDALIELVEAFVCRDKHGINKHVMEDCPMIAIACSTETVLCSNCNTDRSCYDDGRETP